MQVLKQQIGKSLGLALGGMLLGAGTAWADAHGNDLVHSRAFGGQVYMMYTDHMSLYTFSEDPLNASTCYDDCAVEWPPAILESDAELGENYSLIERRDGLFQAAYKGQALYLSSKDRRPGDINGDGIDARWQLARPDS